MIIWLTRRRYTHRHLKLDAKYIARSASVPSGLKKVEFIRDAVQKCSACDGACVVAVSWVTPETTASLTPEMNYSYKQTVRSSRFWTSRPRTTLYKIGYIWAPAGEYDWTIPARRRYRSSLECRPTMMPYGMGIKRCCNPSVRLSVCLSIPFSDFSVR